MMIDLDGRTKSNKSTTKIPTITVAAKEILTKSTLQKHIPVTGIPALAEYHEFYEKSWHKGFVIRNQTTIRLRRHHMELLQDRAKQLPLYLPRKMDLSRWEFGYAGLLIRTLSRIQLRDQLLECNAPPAIFRERRPQNSSEVFLCCFQSAKRCEVDLDLDRLRDTMLDVLFMPLEVMVEASKQDEAFCLDKEKTLEQWNPSTSPQLGASDVKGISSPPSDI